VLLLCAVLYADDTATVTLLPTAGLNTTEAGDTAVFTVALDSWPSAGVTLDIASSNTREGAVSSDAMVFASGDWDIPHTVTVTGVDDVSVDGDIAFTVSIVAMSSSDTNFNNYSVAEVYVSNLDQGEMNMDNPTNQ
jgi:hypothetical protein